MELASERINVLLVEDLKRAWEKFHDDFEALNWSITRGHNAEHAMKRVDEARNTKDKFDVLAIDCEIDGISDRGIDLAITIADAYPNLRILVYTTKSPSDKMDYPLIVRKLSSRGISFMYLTGGNEEAVTLEEAIWATWKGFLIFSPTPAYYLPMAIPKVPDPLDQISWDVLRALNQTSGDRRRAAQNLHMKLPTVNWRISKKIMPILAPIIFGVETAEKMGYYSLNTIDDDEPSTPEDLQQNEFHGGEDQEGSALTDKTLIAWYKENRVRYCRK